MGKQKKKFGNKKLVGKEIKNQQKTWIIKIIVLFQDGNEE